MDSWSDHAVREAAGSPFVALHWPLRTTILATVLVVQVVLPFLAVIVHGSTQPLAGTRMLLHAVGVFLVLLPLIFYRSEYGVLHPLIFPALYGFAKGVFKGAMYGVGMLFDGDILDAPLWHEALAGMAQREIAIASVRYSMMSILALVTYYLAFFCGPRIPVPRLRQVTPRYVSVKMGAVVTLAVTVAMAYIVAQGGITQHMASWILGRYRAMEFHGPVIVLIKSGSVALFVWYVFGRRVLWNPFFGLSAFALVPALFLSTGSRSAIIYPFMLLLMVWMIRHRRLPTVRAVGLAAVAFVLFGVLGLVRSSVYGSGDVDFTAIQEFDLGVAVEYARHEAEGRGAQDAGVGVVGSVPKDVPFLYGESYLGALLFFVPRAVWPDKPRGIGAIYVSEVYGQGEDSYGIPVGPVGEAYWNFDLPGVVLIFFLYGIFHRWLATFLLRNPNRRVAWAFFVPTLFYFRPTTDVIVAYIHFIVMAATLSWWIIDGRRADSTLGSEGYHTVRLRYPEGQSL